MTADGAGIGDGHAEGATRLVDALAGMAGPRIVEVGTLRWQADFPTHHERWAPHGRWLKVDREAGVDVDHVVDAHQMAQLVGLRQYDAVAAARGGFDAYVACSVWEHLERPWRAMEAAAMAVRPGGLVYVQTHQTFPIHGYPDDYYRFSTRALEVQAHDAGLETLHTGYVYPCRIEPPAEVTRWNRAPDVEAWLNVELLARVPV